MHLNGTGYVLREPEFENGKPLYRLSDLDAHPDAPVWITEGEKCANALARLALVATTSGAADSAKRADFTLLEFLALALPARDHILSPWLPRQGLGLIHAPRGVGKTHVALGIACAVAPGDKFLGWEAPKPQGVLFIDGEMPAITLQERLARIIAASDHRLSAPLRLITPDLQSLGMPDLSSADGQIAIDAYMDDIDLIVVDNISTLCRSGKENEAEGWLPVQGWALHQRAQGRSVLFIHHSGKGGAQRGTSKREDVLDTVVSLRRPPDYKTEDGAAFEIHFEKSRGFYGKDAEPFEAKLITDAHDRQTWAMSSLEDSTLERVVQLLTLM